MLCVGCELIAVQRMMGLEQSAMEAERGGSAEGTGWR